MQFAVSRRFSKGLSFGFTDTILLQSKGSTGARLQHNPDGSFSERTDQAQADALLGNYVATRYRFKGNFVWDLPGTKGRGSMGQTLLKWVTNDWRFSGIYTANTASTCMIGVSYQNGAGNQNITGSPNYGYRTRVIGDPGPGCGSDPYRQFNTKAFAPPLAGSVGLESGQDYLRGCFYQQLDFALERSIRLGETRRVSFRLDAFNAPNQAYITGRNTNMNVASQSDYTITDLPFDSAGNLIATRSQPKNSGFGVASGYQGARSLQAWIRFIF